MQDHELDAWLGDTEVTDEQRAQLHAIADTIDREVAEDDRETAFTAAAEVILGDTTIEQLGQARTAARAAAAVAQTRLYAGIRVALAAGESENGIAARAGVDRMTVRKIAGKR